MQADILPPDYEFTYLNYFQGTHKQVFNIATCIRVCRRMQLAVIRT